MNLVRFRDWRNIVRPDHHLSRSYPLKPAYEPTVTPGNVDGTMFIDNRETSQPEPVYISV